MRRTQFVALLFAFACTGAGVAAARSDDSVAPVPPAPSAPPAPPTDAELLAQENDARAKAAAEIADVAKFCEKKSAYDEAKKLYDKAVVLAPDDKTFPADLTRLKNKKDLHSKLVEPQIEDHRAKALNDCTAFLSPVALAQAKANHPDDLERIQMLLRAVGAPPAVLDIAFFAPYLQLLPKKDVEHLTQGWELVDGAWDEPAKVAELDKAHATWDAPWIVSDEFIEVTTNQPLRVARTALAQLERTRRVFLAYFKGEWDLRPPAAKLRVMITDTRSDFDLKVRVESALAEPVPRDAVATFVEVADAGKATVACCELLDFKDHGTRLDFGWVLRPLEREFVHQVAWEYSRHNANPRRPVHAAYWAIDGLADYMTYVETYRDSCVVRRPSWIPWCGKELDTSFTWCRSNYEIMPTMDEITRVPRPKFLKNPAYCRMATTLVWWLLEGKDRANRAGFVKFLQAVHQNKDDSGTLEECVKGVQTGLLDKDFRLFCRDIHVEEK
jgi:hypothetical protein